MIKKLFFYTLLPLYLMTLVEVTSIVLTNLASWQGGTPSYRLANISSGFWRDIRDINEHFGVWHEPHST